MRAWPAVRGWPFLPSCAQCSPNVRPDAGCQHLHSGFQIGQRGFQTPDSVKVCLLSTFCNIRGLILNRKRAGDNSIFYLASASGLLAGTSREDTECVSPLSFHVQVILFDFRVQFPHALCYEMFKGECRLKNKRLSDQLSTRSHPGRQRKQ